MTTSVVLQRFYSPPNLIDLDDLDPSLAGVINTLAKRIEYDDVRTVLPAKTSGTTRWYGLAPSDRQARLLRDEMRSWLGSPISGGVEEVRAAVDELDAMALDLVPGGSVLRADVPSIWLGSAQRNVGLLANVWALSPPRESDVPRPTGRVLRQFFEAILTTDRSGAEDALDEIRARALLTPTNIRFLLVHLLSDLGSPEELINHPSLHGITFLARPIPVTERLAEAANGIFLEPQVAGPRDWKAAFDAIEDIWPYLVTSSEQVTSEASARCFAVREHFQLEPNLSTLTEIISRYPGDPVLEDLRTHGLNEADNDRPPTQIGSHEAVGELLPSPRQLLDAGDYWMALRSAIDDSPASRVSAEVALVSAVALNDSSAGALALTLIGSLDSHDRDELLALALHREFYDRLERLTSDARIPTGWLEWIEGNWDDRPDLLAEWSRHWSRRDFLASEAQDVQLAILDGLNDERRPRLRNGLPVLIDWMVDGGLPVGCIGLAVMTLEIILDSSPGSGERRVGLALVEQVLLVGPDKEEYADLATSIMGQFERLGPRDIQWLTECVDLFVLSSSPDPNLRSQLVTLAAHCARAWVDRLSSTDLTLLRQVFAEANIPFDATVAAEPTETDPVPPGIRTVGIYSLLEGALRVAASRVKSIFPGIEVRTSSDHVNSENLIALARNSDVVVVQTSHAKHAAFHAINAAVADRSQIILVHGRGASAIVRALLDSLTTPEADTAA